MPTKPGICPATIARYMVEVLGHDIHNIYQDYSNNLLDTLEDLYNLETLVTKELQLIREKRNAQ